VGCIRIHENCEGYVTMTGEGLIRFIGNVVEAGEVSVIKIFPEYLRGIRGITGFSNLFVFYWFDRRDTDSDRGTLVVVPRMREAGTKVGVFASRSPSRPNPLGLCVVELVKVEDDRLSVKGLDALVGTPIVDFKPYIPRIDAVSDAQIPEWALKRRRK
jgi:tRNA-Thr(GGU) m(6)t(6)A37 methyltransferase TsaA